MIDPNNNSEYKIEEDVSQEYYKYLIDNIFFKLNSTVYLKKFNSKRPYAVIQKVKINEQLTKKLNDRNNNSSNKTETTKTIPDTENSATVKYPSNDLRLKIDGKDTRYNMYIDLHVLFKKTADEKIDMKTKCLSHLKCNYNATILDELFYRLLKYNYKKNFFRDGLTVFANMSSDKDEVPPAEEFLLQDANKNANKDANKDVRNERYRDYRYGNYGLDGDDMYGPRGGKKNNKRKMNTNKCSIPKNKNNKNNKNNNLKKYKKQKYNLKKNRTFKNNKLSSSNTIKNLIKLYLKT
jgi:hypothetical protein